MYDIGSPAQLSMSRRLNSLLPCTQEQLTPYVIDPDKVVEVMKRKQEMSKEYYDRGTRQLSVLKANDAVRIQMQGRWVPGVVIRQAETPRSYIVKGPSGHEYRRNRKHLRKVAESVPMTFNMDIPCDDSEQQANVTELPDEPPVTNNDRTSCGRTVKAPRRYQDYVRL